MGAFMLKKNSFLLFIGLISSGIMLSAYYRDNQKLKTAQKRYPSVSAIRAIASSRKAVIFDLGNVLIKTSRKKALQYLGKMNLLNYWLVDNKNSHALRTTFYDFLDDKVQTTHQKIDILDPYGKSLPQVFCKLLKGHHNESECHDTIKKLITLHADTFSSAREQELCLKLAAIFFEPTHHVALQETIKEGVTLLHTCHAQGHELFILSNYGEESFALLKEKFPLIFELIPENNLIISAHVKTAKPEKEMYQILLERLKFAGIFPHHTTCFFIDDQEENIDAAQKHAITALHKKGNDLRSVKKKLKEYTVL